MRKCDEGYALALVLVVLVIVCLVAVSILTLSVNNLTAQQNFVSRMQEEYIAKGKVEQIWANLKEEIRDIQSGQYHLTENVLAKICGDLEVKDTAKINCDNSGCNDANGSDGSGAIPAAAHSNELTIEFDVVHETVLIRCEIKLAGTEITTGNLGETKSGVLTHIIKGPIEVEYTKYEINTVDSMESADPTDATGYTENKEPTETTGNGEGSEPA